jgi:hypothetical protein
LPVSRPGDFRRAASASAPVSSVARRLNLAALRSAHRDGGWSAEAIATHAQDVFSRDPV